MSIPLYRGFQPANRLPFLSLPEGYLCHYWFMQTTTAIPRATAARKRSPVPAPPSRELLLQDMLSQTARHGVPIRRRLLQTDAPGASGARSGPLAAMLRTRDSSTLDAYLLIHAMASSSSPYRASYFSNSWVRLMRFDRGAEAAAASSRWSKAITRLEKLQLIKRQRSGNIMNYLLLDESGDGRPYERPTKLAHGRWFSLPHQYWLDGWDEKLTTAEKVMLLIALDQPDGFRIAYERFNDWYGISKSTAKRGLNGLIAHGILEVRNDFYLSGRSPTGWMEIRSYTTQGSWAKAARDKAMKTRAKKHVPIAFVLEEVVEANGVASGPQI